MADNNSKGSSTLSTIDLLDYSASKRRRFSRSRRRGVDPARAERFAPDVETGLMSDQVTKRTEDGLVNAASRTVGRSYARIIFSNLFTYLNLLILVIFIAMMLVVDISKDWSKFLFVVIVSANTIIGIVLEIKSKMTIDRLKLVTAPTAIVVRDGATKAIPVREVVLDDIIYLESGKQICADSVIVRGECEVNESMLTGESVPAEKKTDPLKSGIALGDRRNMAYSGSTVVYGRGRGVVTAVGMDTEMGKIAGVLADVKEEKTPLQRKLGQLSKLLTYIILGICAVVFVVRLVTAGELDARTVLDSFIIAVSLAVAAIPEGMAMVVTLTLSMGVMRMSKKNAVIRRQSAVETLGCAEIICTDKTGTLTQNKMTVVDHVGDEKLLARALALCSDARPAEGGAIGEPTECALVNYATAVGLDKTAMEAETPRIGEVPFDSERKMMTTIHRTPSGNVRYTKGAPDEVLARCTHALEGGRVVPMTDKLRAAALADNKRMADRALRVLAAAYAENAEVITDKPEDMEKDLVYIGLVGMIDPVRPEVREAVERCREAGIRPVMITGDHLDTAVAIAMELGIITDRSQAITGADMAKIPDDEFADRVTEFSVYAHSARMEGARLRDRHDGRRRQRRSVHQVRRHRHRHGHHGHRRHEIGGGHGACRRQLRDNRHRGWRGTAHIRQHTQGHILPAVQQPRRSRGDLLCYHARLHHTRRFAPAVDKPYRRHRARDRARHGGGGRRRHETSAAPGESGHIRGRPGRRRARAGRVPVRHNRARVLPRPRA